MFIKNLHLENFQKHADLKLEFKNDVNIIYGSSDKGKSCIRRAIEWLFFNTKFDGVRKTGTKTTTVTVTLDDDTVVSRIKSASINRYVLKKKNEEEQTFDAIGKSIPDEIKESLKSSTLSIDGEEICLNSSQQLTLPFLFDKSPSFRMKLFNKLTGNDVLDNCFTSFNKDILGLSKEIKREKKSLEDQQEKIEKIEVEKEKAEFIYNKIKKSFFGIKDKYDKYSKLLELKELYKEIEDKLDFTVKELKSLKSIEVVDTKELIEKLKRLDTLKDLEISLEKNKSSLDRVTDDLDKNIPQIKDLSTFAPKINRFDTLKTLIDASFGINEKYLNVKDSISKTEAEINANKKNYLDILKECKECPTCGSEMTEEHIEKVKL